MAMTPKQKKAAACVIAAAIAAPAEGLRHTWYRCPAGIVSVCYGDTKNVDKGKVYTKDECKARLSGGMLAAINTVDSCAPGLGIHELAAFGDAVYNMGPTIACNTKESEAARLLAAGESQKACGQLHRWNKSKVAGVWVALPGLTTRRGIEYQVCIIPDDQPIPQSLVEAFDK